MSDVAWLLTVYMVSASMVGFLLTWAIIEEYNTLTIGDFCITLITALIPLLNTVIAIVCLIGFLGSRRAVQKFFDTTLYKR